MVFEFMRSHDVLSFFFLTKKQIQKYRFYINRTPIIYVETEDKKNHSLPHMLLEIFNIANESVI